MSDNRVEPNNYMINRWKLLAMLEELHRRGYGYLRIVPALSGSGVYWRCKFIEHRSLRFVDGCMWIHEIIEEDDDDEKVLTLTPAEMADRFIEDTSDFLKMCRGDNPEYTRWFSNMLEQLPEGELPFAFADYASAQEEYWHTRGNRRIPILPDEIRYTRVFY